MGSFLVTDLEPEVAGESSRVTVDALEGEYWEYLARLLADIQVSRDAGNQARLEDQLEELLDLLLDLEA